ncbi:nucleotidyltransferase domain-containing protein [Paenibacillus sp. YN15]|uniref:nucleotidyltransferase domain-containing protein n=1 Tax=Paenibacillus sp. YN15 TaxID=1742774 RepID=UPI001C658268|nr:nucleotidyltransferase domain-containing protein [Paenibacillus sp. YN15]
MPANRAGEELDIEPRISAINDFLEAGIAYYEEAAPGMRTAGERQDRQLDELFRSALAEVWG